MADRLSVNLRALHDWFASYADSGVTMKGLGVVATMEMLNGYCAAALALERDGVEQAAIVTEIAAFRREAGIRAQQMRELCDVLAEVRTRQMTGAVIDTLRECAASAAGSLEGFASARCAAPQRSDADSARLAAAVIEGLRSGKIARLHLPLRPKRSAFSDGGDGGAP